MPTAARGHSTSSLPSFGLSLPRLRAALRYMQRCARCLTLGKQLMQSFGQRSIAWELCQSARRPFPFVFQRQASPLTDQTYLPIVLPRITTWLFVMWFIVRVFCAAASISAACSRVLKRVHKLHASLAVHSPQYQVRCRRCCSGRSDRALGALSFLSRS
jgi:hypothetical protein